MDFHIIRTGSKGNAVIIKNEILIDCGVPFRDLKDYYKNLRLVLLTHIHGDHFNRAAIRKLAKERPTLRWGIPTWLVESAVNCGVNKRNIDVVCGESNALEYESFCMIRAIKVPHNVENVAYMIFLTRKAGIGYGEKVFYATDCNSLDHVVAKDFDLYLVEANYTEADILERIKTKEAAGEYCYEWEVLKNHLSKEKADNWLYKNMGANSRYVYLHEHEGEL